LASAASEGPSSPNAGAVARYSVVWTKSIPVAPRVEKITSASSGPPLHRWSWSLTLAWEMRMPTARSGPTASRTARQTSAANRTRFSGEPPYSSVRRLR
jgi:hypothetical protein